MKYKWSRGLRSRVTQVQGKMVNDINPQRENEFRCDQPIAYINHSHPPVQHNLTSQYNQPRPNQYHTPQAKPLNNYQPRPYQANNQNFNRNQPQRAFDPIPVTYAELFAHLQTERVLAPIVGRTPNAVAPWYNPNTSCDYHSGVVGHSTETCRALKHMIQDLIDSKWLEFKDGVPTITGNPLPNHGNQGINVIEQDDDMTIVDKVEGIKTPLKNIFNAMCHHGLVEIVEGRVHEDDVCMMHGTTDHTLEECTEFRIFIQKLMDSRLLVIEKDKTGSNVCVLEGVQRIQDRVITRKFVPVLNIPAGTPSYAAPPRRAPHLYMEAMVTGQPSPFPYQSDKAIPWKYQSDSGAGSGHVDEVVNIAGVGNMTRSGRVYSPVDTPKKIINTSKGRQRDVETTEDMTEVEQDDLFPQKLEREVTQEEACEFLRFIKQSEYQEDGIEEKKRRMTHLGTSRYKGRRTLIPHISESFVRTGFVHPDMVAMVEEYQPEDGTKHVYQCTPGTKLSNWTEEDVASSVYFTM
ncbi:hypothetical protein Lal_00037882 [Lupinus albus]|nr:hypothetical protein Lal_00037882 [Lupinus albus]